MKTQTQISPDKPHPLSGSAMSGAEMIVQVLADEGVDTLFGYSGGAILPTYDAVFRYNDEHGRDGRDAMSLIVPANEQGACFMAAGYARATGRPGVVIVTSGPGATNCVTPVRDCIADSIPIVVICGQVATSSIGTDAFQEAPVTGVMGSVAKHVFLVTDPTRLEATLRSAMEIARSGRPGPVVVDVPKDVQNRVGAYRGEGLLAVSGLSPSHADGARQQHDGGALPGILLAPGRKPPTADLRRRRGHQRERGRGVAEAGAGLPDPRGDDAHGTRRLRYPPPPGAAHARHARHSVRPTMRWTTAIY